MIALQLNPVIPVETPRGKAMAHIMIDYGAEHYVLFLCFLDEARECRLYRNDEVKIQNNETMRPCPNRSTATNSGRRAKK